MSNYNYLDDIDEGVDEPGANAIQPERVPLSNYDRLLLKGKADSGSNRGSHSSRLGAEGSNFGDMAQSHSNRLI